MINITVLIKMNLRKAINFTESEQSDTNVEVADDINKSEFPILDVSSGNHARKSNVSYFYYELF